MKKTKNLKLIFITLICIAIMLVGFFGIYIKNKNRYSNNMKDFTLASDLKGSTVIELEVDNTINTTYYDKDGNEVTVEEGTDTSSYTKKEEPVNAPENLKLENYKKTIDILEKRLKFLGTEQYSLDLDKETGKVFISFESEYSSDVESIMPMEGKLQIKDSSTGDIIIDYTDFEHSETTYASTEKGYTIFMNFKLNHSGVEKMNHIDQYKTIPDTNKEENTEGEEQTSEEKPQAVVMFDGEELDTVSYDDITLNGKTLRITTNKNISDASTVNSKLNTGTVVTKLSNIGKMPIKYKLAAEEYINANIDKNIFKVALIFIVVFALLIVIYFIMKYKKMGIFTSIAFITNIALFIILIKTSKVAISINSIATIVPLFILNLVLVKNMIECIQNKDKTFRSNIANAYLKTIDLIIITAIIFVVLAFSSMNVINTAGLFMFWGWLVALLGNLIFTLPFISILNKE